MRKVGDSRYFEMLLAHNPRSPSITLCRIPELELLSALELPEPVLDHCCGDGFIAETAFGGKKVAAGVDIDRSRLAAARKRGCHEVVEWGDASARLPFGDDAFASVINNSGIEHIAELDGALREISRVLRTGGLLVMNVLNDRYFENWPGSDNDARRYRDWQPFHHALSAEEWTERLAGHGFSDVRFVDYFDSEVSRVLADLDFRYSGFFLRKRFSLRTLYELLWPVSAQRERWRKAFRDLSWDAEPGHGCGFQIIAVKDGPAPGAARSGS